MRSVREHFTQSNLEEVVRHPLDFQPQWIHVKLVGSDSHFTAHIVDVLWKHYPKTGITGHYVSDHEVNHGSITFLGLEMGTIQVRRWDGKPLPEAGLHLFFAGEKGALPEKSGNWIGGIQSAQKYMLFDANGFLPSDEGIVISFYSPTFFAYIDSIPLWQLHVPWQKVEIEGDELIAIEGKKPLDYIREYFHLTEAQEVALRLKFLPMVRQKKGKNEAIPLPIKDLTPAGTIRLWTPVIKEEDEEWGWGLFQSNLWDQLEWIKTMRSKGTQFLFSVTPASYPTFSQLKSLHCFPMLSIPFGFQVMKRGMDTLVTSHLPVIVAMTEDPYYRISLPSDLTNMVESAGELVLLSYEANLIQQERSRNGMVSTPSSDKSIMDEVKEGGELLKEGKLAELGFLTASILHELNTPLAAIHSAITNTQSNLIDTFKLASFLSRELDEQQLRLFYQFGEYLLKNQRYVSSRDERKLKKELTSRLQGYGIQNSEAIARELAKTGTDIPVMEFEALLRHPQAQWLIDVATRLTRLQLNLQNIQLASEKMVNILSSARRYLHDGEHQQEAIVFEVIQTIEDALQLYQGILKRSVEIERFYPESPIYVKGNPSRLTQVWTNLIQNAIHAMDEQGIIRIKVAREQEKAVISITDTGKGIPKEIQHKIFQPFFTTKGSGKGTGLGLPICKKIVEEAKGTIQFVSQPGETTFTVTLPVVEPENVPK